MALLLRLFTPLFLLSLWTPTLCFARGHAFGQHHPFSHKPFFDVEKTDPSTKESYDVLIDEDDPWWDEMFSVVGNSDNEVWGEE